MSARFVVVALMKTNASASYIWSLRGIFCFLFVFFFIFIFVFAIFYLIAHVSSVRLVNSVLNFIFIFIRLFVCTACVPVRVFFLPCCFQFAGVNPFLGIPQSTYVCVCVKFILEHTHMPAHTHK